MADVRNRLKGWKEISCTHTSQESRPVEGGFAEELRRKVRLVALTPTKQVMESTVGREVSLLLEKKEGGIQLTPRQLWFCSLHAIHHYSMLRTIAVHELVGHSFRNT